MQHYNKKLHSLFIKMTDAFGGINKNVCMFFSLNKQFNCSFACKMLVSLFGYTLIYVYVVYTFLVKIFFLCSLNENNILNASHLILCYAVVWIKCLLCVLIIKSNGYLIWYLCEYEWHIYTTYILEKLFSFKIVKILESLFGGFFLNF